MILEFIVGVYVVLFLFLNFLKFKTKSASAKKVAFFHPFCNDGGGGEKVLWSMVDSLLTKPESEIQIAIYSLEKNLEKISSHVKKRFNIDLAKYEGKIRLIHVKGRQLLVPKPVLTMVFHIIFPMIYCFNCLVRYQPDIFYDTTGFAFNFILVKLLLPTTECRAYVHYPFISYDMIRKIKQRRSDFNNDENIAKSGWKSKLKLLYYRAILFLYKFVGFFAKNEQIQVNSSWTYGHMVELWGNGKKIKKLYPPCSISHLLKQKKNYGHENKSFNKIVSLAQFRPEKNHLLQIKVMKRLIEKLKLQGQSNFPTLSICGTTRGPDDEALLHSLQKEVKEQRLQEFVSFHVNMPFQGIISKLLQSTIGIHTMEAEHFGISVVEMLSSGCIVVAHNSAGPKEDIIRERTSLAETEDEYYERMLEIIKLNPKQQKMVSEKYRERMKEFGEAEFSRQFRQIFYQK